jgi:predicted nucleic acid-binding protein
MIARAFDAVRPYLATIRAVCTLVACAFVFAFGVSHGAHRSALRVIQAEHARDQWRQAASGWELAVKAQEIANRARIEEAEAGKRRAELAADVAAAAARRAEQRAATLDADLARARRRPACAALLDADLAKVCGL